VCTEVAYKKDLVQFEAYVREYTRNSEVDLTIVDVDLIRLWTASLMDKKLSPASVNRKLSALKSYFKYLIKQGLISNNPACLVSGPKCARKLPQIIEETEMVGLLDRNGFSEDFVGVRDRLILEFLYETGLRRQELVLLKCSDVDLDAMQMKVYGKRGKERLIPFGDRLKGRIVEFLKRRKIALCDNEVGSFFVRKDGSPITGDTIYHVVNRSFKNGSLCEKHSPHTFRHTFATCLLNDGVRLNAVKELLGHSSLASTSIYTHITFEKLREMYYAHPRLDR
jgi:hypothetical protein